jgi:hypothetical protein
MPTRHPSGLHKVQHGHLERADVGIGVLEGRTIDRPELVGVDSDDPIGPLCGCAPGEASGRVDCRNRPGSVLTTR